MCSRRHDYSCNDMDTASQVTPWRPSAPVTQRGHGASRQRRPHPPPPRAQTWRERGFLNHLTAPSWPGQAHGWSDTPDRSVMGASTYRAEE